MIISEQIRAARGLLGWSQGDLAKAANLGVATIRRMENAKGTKRGAVETLWKIQNALEQGGVQFIYGDDVGGPGVRLKNAL